jgi:hypothetical protein
VKALIDPDILELRQKRWNISCLPYQNEKPELKKTLFEVRHGLTDVKVIPLQDKKLELGTDSRDACYLGWNVSTLLTRTDKKDINYQK